MVFADRILGKDAPETSALRVEWNAALDNSTLDTLRFAVGTEVKVVAGEHAGRIGTIERFGLRQVKSYWIKTTEGEMVAAADNEVEPVSDSRRIRAGASTRLAPRSKSRAWAKHA